MGLYCVIDISAFAESQIVAYIAGRQEFASAAANEIYSRGWGVLDRLMEELQEAQEEMMENADEDGPDPSDQQRVEDLKERIEEVMDALDAAGDAWGEAMGAAEGASLDLSSIEQALAAFESAFYSSIGSNCPVRTGRLKSSCMCIASGTSILCAALTSYAQYVEYGTSKMSAQPYFEPAVQEGVRAMIPYLQQQSERTQQSASQDGRSDASRIQSAASSSPDLAGAIGGVGGFIAVIAMALILALVDEFLSMLFDDLDAQSYQIGVF